MIKTFIFGALFGAFLALLGFFIGIHVLMISALVDDRFITRVHVPKEVSGKVHSTVDPHYRDPNDLTYDSTLRPIDPDREEPVNLDKADPRRPINPDNVEPADLRPAPLPGEEPTNLNHGDVPPRRPTLRPIDPDREEPTLRPSRSRVVPPATPNVLHAVPDREQTVPERK
jgi:hypothetical protein